MFGEKSEADDRVATRRQSIFFEVAPELPQKRLPDGIFLEVESKLLLGLRSLDRLGKLEFLLVLTHYYDQIIYLMLQIKAQHKVILVGITVKLLLQTKH